MERSLENALPIATTTVAQRTQRFFNELDTTGNTSAHSLADQTDFGVFYAVDYFVVAFPDSAQAAEARCNVLVGGYETDDCVQYTSAEVVAAAETNLGENSGFFARLGWSRNAVQIQLDAAREGAAFLLGFASGDTSDADVMLKVNSALHQNANLQPLSISVVTAKGDVRLTGEIASADQYALVVKIARSTEGVHSIHEELTIKK